MFVLVTRDFSQTLLRADEVEKHYWSPVANRFGNDR